MNRHRKGLFSLGRIENLLSCVKSFNALREKGRPVLDLHTIDEMVKYSNKEYFSQEGHLLPRGNAMTPKNAMYIHFRLPVETKDGHAIHGWFKKEAGIFKGPVWGTKYDFENQLNRDCSIGKAIAIVIVLKTNKTIKNE